MRGGTVRTAASLGAARGLVEAEGTALRACLVALVVKGSIAFTTKRDAQQQVGCLVVAILRPRDRFQGLLKVVPCGFVDE
jgi:hypothetical protein